MRKIFLNIFIFLLLAENNYSFCQNSLKFSAGAHAGPAFSNLVRNLGFYRFMPGYKCGGHLIYSFDSLMFVKADISFTRKAYNLGIVNIQDRYGNIIAFAQTKNLLNAVNIPFMFGYNILKNRMLFANAGIYAEFLINALAKYDFTYLSPNISALPRKIDISGNYRKTGFGMAAGIGYKHPYNKSLDIFAEFRTNYGLSPVFNDDSPPRNILFELSLALNFKNLTRIKK